MNQAKGGTMIQINGDKVEDTSIIGKTLLDYIIEAGYNPVGIFNKISLIFLFLNSY